MQLTSSGKTWVGTFVYFNRTPDLTDFATRCVQTLPEYVTRCIHLEKELTLGLFSDYRNALARPQSWSAASCPCFR